VTTPAALAERLLDVVEGDIVPLTRAGVAAGNKLFGAAILRADLSLALAETNAETENPLWHGEVHALKRLYERPAAERPDPATAVFLSTHEPCSLCLSAIAWTGFRRVFFLFTHQDSRDAFAIPHDIRILQEVFPAAEGAPLYRRDNAFFAARPIAELIAEAPPVAWPALTARVAALREVYAGLSEAYQAGKGGAGIPLA
jgi:tRNA(Arg) A34 adenosine deaminase TadA